jgi:hypothetical protein
MDWIYLAEIGTGDRLLWTRQWTFGFHKMRGISWLAEELLASQKGFIYMQLITTPRKRTSGGEAWEILTMWCSFNLLPLPPPRSPHTSSSVGIAFHYTPLLSLSLSLSLLPLKSNSVIDRCHNKNNRIQKGWHCSDPCTSTFTELLCNKSFMLLAT